jgi:outer membrane protein assembly factor BamB
MLVRILILSLALLWATLAHAASVAGVVASVDSSTGSLTVDAASKKGQEFTTDEKTNITLDGKKATLADLAEGQRVTVTTTTAGKVTRIVAKSVAGATPRTGGAKSAGTSANSGWHQYGGPNRDNVSPETGLLKSWPSGGPELKWTASGMGEGYSSVSLSGDKLLTMGNRGNEETTICLNAETGKELWATPTGNAYREGQGNGPRATPTIDGDKVYVLGANGDLACLELASGKKVWGGNILQEFNANNITWGISESVLIDGPNLVCTPGGRGAAMVSLDKTNGKLKWKASVPGDPQTGYSSILPIEFGGTRMYVNFVHTGVIAVDAKNGNLLWGNKSPANGTANCSSPVFEKDSVFAASGYGTGGTLIKMSGSRGKITAEEVYSTKDMKSHHGGMVVVDGYLYGADDGVLKCLELKTGNVQWQDRSVGKGAIVYADGMLIHRSENGPVALVKATPTAYEETGRFEPSRSNKPAWPHPVVANGCLFLRDMDQLLCYKVK